MGQRLTSYLIPTAIDRFTAKVRAVPEDGWDGPTPDAEWTVRDLVTHVTREHLWVPHLLRGETIEQVGDQYEGEVLGDDPAEAWARAAAESRKAWLDADPDGEVHLSIGPASVAEYGAQMHLDLVLHGWDLARGTGQDDSIEPDVARVVLEYIEPLAPAWAEAGVFAAPVPGDFTTPADRLLALAGRDPR